MPHLPAPDAVREIRAAATANQLALTSVADQIDHYLSHVATFPNSPSKGRLRDGLARLQARYRASAGMNGDLVRLSTNILELLGTPAPPADDPPVAPTTWSTGNW